MKKVIVLLPMMVSAMLLTDLKKQLLYEKGNSFITYDAVTLAIKIYIQGKILIRYEK